MSSLIIKIQSFTKDLKKFDKYSIQQHPDALVFSLYSDEFEIVNALGTNVRKHKLVAFFWMLLNIPPEYSGSLVAGNLLAIAKSVDIKQFGIEILLQDFIDSMKQLATGVAVLVRGANVYVHGMLGPVFGDTPASAFLGGFKVGVGGATRWVTLFYFYFCLSLNFQLFSISNYAKTV